MNTIKMDILKHFGLFMLYNMSNFTNITADIVLLEPEYNVTDFDNIIMSSLWLLNACSCGVIIFLNLIVQQYKKYKKVV